MSVVFLSDIILVPNPRMPATKENLKYKYNKLGKELDAISSQYEDDVYSVIQNLKRRYNETRTGRCLATES